MTSAPSTWWKKASVTQASTSQPSTAELTILSFLLASKWLKICASIGLILNIYFADFGSMMIAACDSHGMTFTVIHLWWTGQAAMYRRPLAKPIVLLDELGIASAHCTCTWHSHRIFVVWRISVAAWRLKDLLKYGINWNELPSTA